MNGVSAGIGDFSDRVQAIFRQISRPSPHAVHYEAARLEIRTHPAQMDVDMSQVWADIGVLSPASFMREAGQRAERAYSQGVLDQVHNGRRIRDIHREKGNVYGRIAFEKFMRSANKQVVLAGAPKQPAKVDIRIVPPEIHIDTVPLLVGVPPRK